MNHDAREAMSHGARGAKKTKPPPVSRGSYDVAHFSHTHTRACRIWGGPSFFPRPPLIPLWPPHQSCQGHLWCGQYVKMCHICLLGMPRGRDGVRCVQRTS